MYFYNQTPIRLIELFAGIGSQAKALTNLGLNFEHYRVCEFDKHAIRSYNAVHGTNFVTSDITKINAADLNIVDTDKYTYLLTYSFPCQDLSNAGKGGGMEKGSGTRSGLLWEVERLLNECTELPQVLLMENVPQVHGKKNIEHFNKWIAFLESKGYSNYWKDLNAKDYGIPQNRNRCFMVSIRKDVDTGIFEFPEGYPLKLRLKDMLEDVVDEKFYLSEKALLGIQNSTYQTRQPIVQEKDWCDTLLSRDYKDPKCVKVAEPVRLGNIYGEQFGTGYAGNVWDKEGISPTLMTMNGGNRQPIVVVREATKQGYAEAYEGDSINLEQPNSTTRRGRVGHQVAQTLTTSPQQAVVEPKIKVIGNYSPSGHDASRVVCAEGLAPTVKENHSTVTATNVGLRIRKLTPKECWRLMGFDDTDFEKAAKVNSNTQLYKQAGNSIVVNVLMAIFRELFIPDKTRSEWLDELLRR